MVFNSLEEARSRFFNHPEASIDLVVDTTSGLLQELYPKMACGGTYMAIGLKQKQATINTIYLADRSLTILGSIDSMHGSFLEAFYLITKGIIPVESFISHVFPLEKYKEAFSVIGCNIDSKRLAPPREPSRALINIRIIGHYRLLDWLCRLKTKVFRNVLFCPIFISSATNTKTALFRKLAGFPKNWYYKLIAGRI
jgi:hypothetical protein